MAEFKRENLQNFVNDGAKDHPPVFIGRKEILDCVLTKARRAGERQLGLPGNATIIQGAPGAGKSSVLSQLEIRAPMDVHARVVKISSVYLEERIPEVVRAIAFAGASEQIQWFDLWTRLGPTWLQNLPHIKDIQIPSYTDLTDLQEKRPRSTWKAPVIVAVDETQNLPSGKSSAPAKFLRFLHEGSTTLPITLVLAGLSDTNSIIQEMGLTHGVEPLSLGCFKTEELSELTCKYCAHFGIKIGSQRNRIDGLMAPTDGWPRHVYWAQQALAAALLADGIDGKADRISDWPAIYAQSETLRQGYYRTQYSDVMKRAERLTTKVMWRVAQAEALGEGISLAEIIAEVDAACDSNKGGKFRMPLGYNEETFVTHLIHRGVLQDVTDSNAMTCPIPSFQTYILKRGGQDPSKLQGL
ncbi:MAG: hypothetical protein OXE94_05860 [Aestuariivita sp.]|nr:hypothetical protein [Aestuariivita sp.]MCY4201500.1 hypothetical protein [Aestuariivita sp.]